MTYTIEWKDQALKDLEKLDKETQKRIKKKIESITEYPYHFLEPLKNEPYHKLRTGKYRTIINVKENEKTLEPFLADHRKKIYKRLKKKTKKP